MKVGDTVRTVAELDGLAHGSVVLDYFDDAHQKADGVWREAARREERDASGDACLRPLHRPVPAREGRLSEQVIRLQQEAAGLVIQRSAE